MLVTFIAFIVALVIAFIITLVVAFVLAFITIIWIRRRLRIATAVFIIVDPVRPPVFNTLSSLGTNPEGRTISQEYHNCNCKYKLVH
jgi:hypothetical protein